MSWNDFYRRRDVIDAVLRQARGNPRGELPFAGIAGAEELFGTKENLLLALHHNWSRLLAGYLRAESVCPDDAHAAEPEDDSIDAVIRAWRKATTEHATLHAVLEANLASSPALLAMHRDDQRMLAVTAGLAGAGEPIADIAKVGVALDALLRSGSARPARRRSPVGHLLRMLAPSA
jgi:hypothetical protein